MAINIPIISDFTDAGIKNAQMAFQKFKTEVGKAEGAMGKLKAGAGVAFESIKANAGAFALGAGAAIAGFAIKAAGAFKDLALQADKFSTATGLAVEDASRWIEVAGDLEVPIEAVEKAMGKLAKQIGSDPEILRDLGDDAAYLADGSLDVNKTFLNVIQRLKDIEDPAERAAVGSKLLGKSWMEMSQLIQAGSGELTKSLGQVADAKVINESEVAKAKQFREAMDNFRDKLEEFVLDVGSSVIPMLSDLVDVAGEVIDAIRTVGQVLSNVAETGNDVTTAIGLNNDAFERGIELAKEQATASENLYNTWKDGYAALRGVTDEVDELTYSEEKAKKATWELTDAWQDMLNAFDLQTAFRDARQSIAELQEKAAEAFGDPTKVDDYRSSLRGVYSDFELIMKSMELTARQQDKIKFIVDTSGLDAALEALNRINLAATGQIQVELPRFGGPRADGGPVMGGTAYLVGERGPEIFMPSSSGTILPNSTTANTTVNVNVVGADPDDTVRAIQRWARTNGNLSLATTTAVRR